ncbi:MAG: MFS transporter [Ignavibacteriae bacterium]|nr:MFS transporter [Ignavibacteria bacterium]MBI3364635.1 MFS transporter [Ignavibacteriota bacterium]
MDEAHSVLDRRSSQLGIRQNLPQFSLLVLINAFVGAMVGIERSILPLIAEREFGIASRSAILSFLISFGIVKALSNLLAGRLSDRGGRKKLLVLGWLIGLPVPFVLMWAPSWSWIVVANILLGINQGLCWSTTVIMKIDLSGPKQRGLAMGLNEFAGYIAVAIAAYWSASLAADYGLRPVPFYLGVAVALLGFFFSLLFVRETDHHAHAEQAALHPPSSHSFKQVFLLTSWKDRNLLSCSQAGLINNLNDGMAWGLFPLFFASLHFSLDQIGTLTALYPAAWGLAQLATGALSDRVGRKWMIVLGMWAQAGTLWLMVFESGIGFEMVTMILLGLGTAMVYPTLLAAVGDASYPEWRASAVGVYRLWRDLGYAVGAILSGIIADLLGIKNAILFVGLLTCLSGVLVAALFRENSSAVR